MAERIDLPPTLQGDEKAQLQQLWSYLYQMSEAINNNLDAIGGNDLTDRERATMQQILQAAGVTQDGVSTDYETLKSLIIKTADFVQTSLQEYRMVLFGETVAAGQFGQYNRRTGMDVAVTPEGILQKFSLREIVKDLKTYEVNAKNYIKTGLLRTVSSIPVYGVAIGKDVVTFSENGTETYNDGNKVAELTADELSFWQSGVKIAKYTGSRISFYYNGTEAFYIQNGKLYAVGDMEITNGKKLILASGADMEVASGGDLIVKSGGTFAVKNASNNNVIKMDSSGIDVESGGDIKIKSGGSFEVQSGGTFDVTSANFSISSLLKKMVCGKWEINQYGLLEKYYDTVIQKNVGIAFGEYEGFIVNNIPVLGITGGFAQTPGKDAGILYITMKYQDETFSRILFEVFEDYIKIHAQKGQLNSTQGLTELPGHVGDPLVPWNFYGDTIYYHTLVQNSSRYKKQDIKTMEPVGEKIDKLEPVTFIYKNDQKGQRRAGLIYEDAVNVMPEICVEHDGEKAINYVEMIPMLLKEIQDLRARVKALEER